MLPSSYMTGNKEKVKLNEAFTGVGLRGEYKI